MHVDLYLMSPRSVNLDILLSYFSELLEFGPHYDQFWKRPLLCFHTLGCHASLKHSSRLGGIYSPGHSHSHSHNLAIAIVIALTIVIALASHSLSHSHSP